MNILRRIKLGIQGMMAKRQRRRQRVKGTAHNTTLGRNWQTDAQRLVESYYTGRFNTKPVPTGAGVRRAAERLRG